MTQHSKITMILYQSTKTLIIGFLGLRKNHNSNAIIIFQNLTCQFLKVFRTHRRNYFLIIGIGIHATTQIIIEDYSLIVAKNKTIKINVTGLPSGYSLDDLQYHADKP